MKTCADFDLKHCCSFCHEEWQDGWNIPIPIFDKKGNLYAEVCCSHIDFAEKEVK